MIIDTHAHLHGPEYDGDRGAVLHRARAAGVEAIVNIGTSVQESEQAIALAHAAIDGWPELFATYGIHPHDARHAPPDLEARIARASEDPRVVGIGEVGLDYHYDNSPRDAQQAALRRQIRAAVAAGAPLVFHQRDAEDDFAAILREELPPGYPGLLHCFTGGPEDARRWTGEFGLLLAIGGAVTFRSAGRIRDAVQAVGAQHLLFETDSPYMTPAPYRGRRNEPAYVALVVRLVAELLGLTYERLADVSSARARAFFRLG